MGTEMIAFIEYDKHLYYRENDLVPRAILPPFSDQSDTYCLTEKGGLYTGSKDYPFFSAIAGVRNETGKPPLYLPRGLPPNPSLVVQGATEDQEGTFEDGFATGWLLLREINAALAHQDVNRRFLSFETHVHLQTMADLESRLGQDRVRLVFTFS